MSIRNKIGEGVLYGSISNILIKVFAAVGYFLIIRELSLHDYGVFVLLTSIIGPASAIVFLSMDRIFVSRYAQAKAQERLGYLKGLVKEYYFTSSIILIAIVVFGLFAGDLLDRFYDLYVTKFFWGTVTLVVSQILMNQVSLFLEANEKFREISFLQTGESISRIIFVVLITSVVGLSINLVLFIYAAAKVVSILIGFIYFVPMLWQLKNIPTPSEKGILIKILFTVGKWEIARNFFEQTLQMVKFLIIKFFVNIEGVAVFDFARNIYAFANSIFPISKIIFPVIARSISDKDKISLIISKAKKYSLLSYVPIYCAALVLTTPVLENFFPQYVGTEIIIYLLLAHFLTDVYKIGQSPLLYAFNRQKFIFFVTPLFVFMQIALDIVFVSVFGLIGVVLSWHLHAFLTGAVYSYYIHHYIGIRRTSFREFFRFDSYDMLILSGIMGRARRIFLRN